MDDPVTSGGGPFDLAADMDVPSALARLPAGRHGLPREFVAANQRNRLMAAGLDVFAERGYAEASIADMIKLAGVSRNTYYAHFDDKEACLLATADTLLAWSAEQVTRSSTPTEPWARRVASAVDSLAALLDEDLRIARLLCIELLRAGPSARCRHEALIDRLAAALRPGREIGDPVAEMPATFEPALVAGVLSVLTRRVTAGEVGALSGLAPELSELLLTPYIGFTAADRLLWPAGRP